MGVRRGRRAEDRFREFGQRVVAVFGRQAWLDRRDLIPPPVDLDDDMLDQLGNQMLDRIEQLRDSTIEKLRVRGRTAMLRVLSWN
jgi:hypothetical protein